LMGRAGGFDDAGIHPLLSGRSGITPPRPGFTTP
jgi:hypothetical protein